MSDYVDPPPHIVESTKRTPFDGLFTDFVLRQFCRVVESLFGHNSVFRRRNYHLAGMATEPIDISSSEDSDFRAIDNYKCDESPLRDSATSSNTRVLPEWSSLPSSNLAGNGGPSQRATSPKRSLLLNGRSPNFTPPTIAKQRPGTSSGTVGASYLATSRDDNSEYFNKNDDDWHSSKRARRTLPASFQPPLPNSRSKDLVENIGGSQFRESHGNSYYAVRPNLTNGENFGRDRFGKGSDDDIVIYESKVNRVLPPSLMYGKPASTSYANTESLYYRGAGEERSTGTDERLIFQAALQDLNQPKSEANLPEGLLSVSLLRHQKIALRWMMLKETEGVNCLGGILADDQGLGKTISMIAIIQAHKSLQEESKTENQCSAKTEALNLDDDDDENSGGAPDKLKSKGESDELKVISEGSSSLQFRNRKPAAGTLVVCPASVLRQWARELDDKVTEEAKLSVLIYHGGNRTKDADELAKYDVVLTTYAIVTNEVPKQPLVDEDNEQNNGERYGVSAVFSQNKKQMKTVVNKRGRKRKNGYDNDANCGTLARVRWFRVILDEAQTIKNHRTQVARACCSLRAKRRWCLSGTPIQNAIDELFSYFRFLKYEPYCKFKSFCEGIKIPISRDSVRGYTKLQLILRSIMLRRTKGTLIDGQPIITLPPKTINLTKVDFTADERSFYNKLEADSRSQFKAYAAAGTLNQNYANILLMLLRLRQACDHPQLVKGVSSDSAGRESLLIAKKLPKQKLGGLLKLLETSFALCSACNDPPEDAVVTVCGHVFCFQCVSDYLTGEDNTCPAFECKEQLNADVIFSKATLKKCLFDDGFGDPSSSFGDEKSKVLKNNYSSSKIKAALEILQTFCKPSPDLELNSTVQCTADTLSSGNRCPDSQISRPTKAIVFSQWTGMLDLVEVALNKTGINYQRLDGTMSLAARDRAVKEFNTNPEVVVMLMSLKAGNLGLNMVAACRVILLDLWWNPTTEDQAVDRAHRIGQTRPVTVSRLTIRDTVEDRILALQEEKRKMVASAFGEDQSGASGTRLTMEDLKYLFGA